jgi:hypothetical protein
MIGCRVLCGNIERDTAPIRTARKVKKLGRTKNWPPPIGLAHAECEDLDSQVLKQ